MKAAHPFAATSTEKTIMWQHRWGWLADRALIPSIVGSLVLPRYFLYQLLSPTIQDDHIQPLSKGCASPHLNIGSLRKFPFILPALHEQLRIVSELDALQRKVHAVEVLQAHTTAELEALLPAVLDKAFKGELLGDEVPALLEFRA
jgi:type I restriction enzyme, S subunit